VEKKLLENVMKLLDGRLSRSQLEINLLRALEATSSAIENKCCANQGPEKL